jgi:hypothetical protein
MYAGENFSRRKLPDDSTIQKPFSYIVPQPFPFKTVIYDKDGKEVKGKRSGLKRNYSKRFYGDAYGKRNMNWRNDEAATLYYVEA